MENIESRRKMEDMNRPVKRELGDVITCHDQRDCKQTFKGLQREGYDGVVDPLYQITITKVPE